MRLTWPCSVRFLTIAMAAFGISFAFVSSTLSSRGSSFQATLSHCCICVASILRTRSLLSLVKLYGSTSIVTSHLPLGHSVRASALPDFRRPLINTTISLGSTDRSLFLAQAYGRHVCCQAAIRAGMWRYATICVATN